MAEMIRKEYGMVENKPNGVTKRRSKIFRQQEDYYDAMDSERVTREELVKDDKKNYG